MCCLLTDSGRSMRERGQPLPNCLLIHNWWVDGLMSRLFSQKRTFCIFSDRRARQAKASTSKSMERWSSNHCLAARTHSIFLGNRTPSIQCHASPEIRTHVGSLSWFLSWLVPPVFLLASRSAVSIGSSFVSIPFSRSLWSSILLPLAEKRKNRGWLPARV